MNFRPIIEFEAGLTCINCWGVGKAFGDVPTPKRITITGAGFAGADAPLNGTFIAEQLAVVPCQWLFNNGIVYGSWTTGPALTTFVMGLFGQPPSYNRLELPCARVSTFGAESMTIEIEDPPTPEHKFAKDQNFSPNDITYYDNFGAIDGNEVAAIAKRSDRIRLFFEYEPDY